MTMFALGPEGTFSHEVAGRLSPSGTIRLVPTIGQVFAAVEEGLGDGVVPVENSEAGGVGPTLDGLMRYDVSVTGELYMAIHHFLASFVPIEEISVVYAHPQTIEQCSIFLDRLGKDVIPTKSNAASAVELRADRNAGAVVSEKIAEIYSLPLVQHGIENNPENITRFLRIGHEPLHGTGMEKCSIIVDPDTDRPGLLYDLLGVFARKEINLCRIESRPSRRGIGSYVFFMDIAAAPGFSGALDELRRLTNFKHLGCYKKIGAGP